MRRFYIPFVVVFFSSCALFRPSAKTIYLRNTCDQSCYDAIIVPGAPANSVYSKKILQMRLSWAVHLYRSGKADKIIMSGAAVSTPYKESVIMKEYAVRMGVPAEDILTEEKAEHTTENFWYGYLTARKLGYSSVAVATDPWQTRIFFGFRNRRIPELRFLPVMTDSLVRAGDTLPHIDFELFKESDFVPLNQKKNRLERLRGTIGKNIDYTVQSNE